MSRLEIRGFTVTLSGTGGRRGEGLLTSDSLENLVGWHALLVVEVVHDSSKIAAPARRVLHARGDFLCERGEHGGVSVLVLLQLRPQLRLLLLQLRHGREPVLPLLRVQAVVAQDRHFLLDRRLLRFVRRQVLVQGVEASLRNPNSCRRVCRTVVVR